MDFKTLSSLGRFKEIILTLMRYGFSAFGVIGYLISACVGLWLVISIIRTRRY